MKMILTAVPVAKGGLLERPHSIVGLMAIVVLLCLSGCGGLLDLDNDDRSSNKVEEQDNADSPEATSQPAESSQPEQSQQQAEDHGLADLIKPCPKPPTEWKIPVGTNNPDADEEGYLHLKAADYPEAEPVRKTSIDLEMNGAYVRERTRALLNEAVGKPFEVRHPLGSFKVGVSLGSITLDPPNNVPKYRDDWDYPVRVTFEPWIGNEDHPQGEYRLSVRIVPYLITPDTVKEEKKRRAYLQTTDRGAAFRFELVELYNITDQQTVCSGSNSAFKQELISRTILEKLYEASAAQPPIVLPEQDLTGLANSILSTEKNKVETKLVGVTVASLGALKIGVKLDKPAGGHHPFSWETLANNPPTSLPAPVDLGLAVDESYFKTAMKNMIREEVEKLNAHPRVQKYGMTFTLDSDPVVHFYSGGIGVTINVSTPPPRLRLGPISPCGPPAPIRFSYAGTVKPQVSTQPGGTIGDESYVGASLSGQLTVSDWGSPRQATCGLLAQRLVPDLFNPKLPPLDAQPVYILVEDKDKNGEPNKCVDEILYATGIDTFDRFYIAGRSTFMDQTYERFPSTECPPPT
jgi:hypothetical protein